MVEKQAEPRHFRIVAIAGLLWSGLGAYDFVRTVTRDPAYLASWPAEAIQRLDAMPSLAVAAWGLGVVGAVLGSLLLLARSRLAAAAFVVPLASFVALLATGHLQSGVLSGAAAALFLAYAVRMRQRGVLR